MSSDKNIENFDSFFQEAFNSFEPQPPQGVFEAVQSQIGSAGAGGAGGASGAGSLGNAGAWGLGKIIIGVFAAATVATTVYLTTSDDNANTQNQTAQTAGIEQKGNTALENTIENGNADAENTDADLSADDDVTNASTDKAGKTVGSSVSTNSSTPLSPLNNSGTSPETPNAESSVVSGVNSKNKTQQENNGGTDVPDPKQQKAVVGMYLSDKQLCANERLTITIADDLSKTGYKVDFGDGVQAFTKIGTPTIHKYSKGGTYKIVATATDNTKETKEQIVRVNSVNAEFATENIEDGTYRFTNKSKNAVHFNWFFGDRAEASQEESPVHTFKNFEPKEYKVKLIAIDNMGCLDSFSTRIKQNYTYENLKPKMYNVFSPGIDGRNDNFEIEIENEEKYHLTILDKNGAKVFESSDKNITWNGRNMYTGEDCPAANYAVVFLYKIKGFEEQRVQRYVTLVR